MKYLNKTNEELEKRIKKLQDLGFECYNVECFKIGECGFKNVLSDFSAIDENQFVQHAIKEAIKFGIQEGRNQLKLELKNLIEIKEEGE